MVKSGELNKQEKWVYNAICDYVKYSQDNFTTKNIAAQMKGSPFLHYKNYDICRKRFSGLQMKGKIELTGDRRDDCRVWRLL